MDSILRRTSHFSNPFIVEEAEQVAMLQNWLISLTKENFEITKENIMKSMFVKTKERILQLVQNVYLVGECRPFLIPLVCDLCKSLAAELPSELGFKSRFLRVLFMPPTRHSAHLLLIRQLMYRNLISGKDVVKELNRFLTTHPDRIEDMLSTFCIFAPEIEILDKPLFDSILAHFRTRCVSVYLPPELTLFIDSIEFLRANSWKLLKEKADFGFNSEPISVAIKDDNLDALIEMSKKPNFNKNERVRPSVFERCKFLWNEPTLVQFAAFHGAVKCFNYLIEQGADLSMRTSNNFTTLCFAVAGGQWEIIHIMEGMGVDFSGSLQTAALMLQNEIFRWLFEHVYHKNNESLSHIHPDLGSVLHCAAASNNTELILFCLARGVDINIPDRTELRPIHLATEKWRMDALNLLLQHTRVDVNAGDENDETPLHVAALNGRYKAMQLLVQHPCINVNANEKFDKTPLHFGAQEGYSKAMRTLLAQPGIDVNALDEDSATPLHCAAHNGRWDAIGILCKEPSILVNARDTNGWAPLHYAAQGGYAQTVRRLVAHKDIDVNAQTVDGWTPLHLAIQESHVIIVQIFLAHEKIDVNVSFREGWTALHSAVMSKSIQIVRLLLNYPGIDLNAKYNGMKAHDLAVAQGCKEIAAMIQARIERG